MSKTTFIAAALKGRISFFCSNEREPQNADNKPHPWDQSNTRNVVEQLFLNCGEVVILISLYVSALVYLTPSVKADLL